METSYDVDRGGTTMRNLMAGFAAALVLAGCGRNGGTAGNGVSAEEGAGSADRTPVRSVSLTDPAIAGWKATDACALVPEAQIAPLLHGAVKRTELSGGDGTDPATSTCLIILEDGSEFRLSAYKSANGADAAARNLQRNFAATAAGADPVDVAGLGEAAFWSPEPRDLWVFFDSARSVEVKVDGKRLPGDATIKANAIALARKAGGA